MDAYNVSGKIFDKYGDILDFLHDYYHDFDLLAFIFRSRDPNDKLGPAGYGSAGYLPAGGVMAYQILFENQPSATAPAQRVTVSDTLDPNLDLSTFELTEIAFANQTLALPAGLNHYETRLAFTVTNQTLIPLGDASAFALALPPTNAILVEVAAHLDVPTRLLTLSLTSLDPEAGWYPENPLLGLLYPNDTNHIGEGSLSYFVRPVSDLPSGARVANRASIVFDYNDPIETPLIFNTIDADAPSSRMVSAIPSEDGTVTVTWAAEDDAGGAGLASVDLLVSSDGANYVRWAERLSPQQTSAVFTGSPGVTYRFIAVARDNAGNEQSQPTQPGATVRIPVPPPVIETVAITAEGALRLRASGSPNVTFDVEASEDLQTWNRVGSALGAADGSVEFEEPQASTFAQRFYRLIGP